MESLFKHTFTDFSNEIFDEILSQKNITLERIISKGHRTPDGEWLQQERAEFVVVLKGSAGIIFKRDNILIDMVAGDYLNILPNEEHRVEYTSNIEETIWLALHYE